MLLAVVYFYLRCDIPLIQNSSAPVILRFPKSAKIAILLISHDWLPFRVWSTYKITYLSYHWNNNTAPSCVINMLQKKLSHSRNTRSSSHTIHLLDMRHAITHRLMIARFLLLQSGTLFKMMSRVHNHCHYLSFVWRHTCFAQFTRSELFIVITMLMVWQSCWFFHIFRINALIFIKHKIYLRFFTVCCS